LGAADDPLLEKSVLKSHDLLGEEGKKGYGGRGGATTLTMVAVLWPHAYVIQVGDRRCNWLRDGRLECVTQDQTLAQALIEKELRSSRSLTGHVKNFSDHLPFSASTA
jgi:serine/threonine protein phosphatase PrpC